MVLRKIMQELDNNMQLTNHAMTREDWDVVAKTALLIAEHPEPPFSEKLRIMMFFGRDISRLKQLDGQTHQAAKNLATEAKTGNRQNIISSFNTLEQSCTNCHQQFKNAFVKHFYKP
jgi:formate-dependent nitrite reductase cytochrome c552 subunit